MKRTTGTNNSNPTYPKRSYLWIVTLALFGIRPRYQWYNGFRPLPNDSLLFRIKLQTPEGRFSFSRDTTAGQVICIQIDTKNDSSNNVKIYGIYFEAGPDEPLRNNMNLRRAIIYTGDTGYRSYFVADSLIRTVHPPRAGSQGSDSPGYNRNWKKEKKNIFWQSGCMVTMVTTGRK